ncbi:MAG: hypothetical protein M1831_007234 [Alyxoria varia]|nr:MAG: hypothetical protein M1831_007234 [Alyxoria varia]
MDQDDDFSSWDNSHRAFLQAFLARSTFTFPQAKPVLATIMSAQQGRGVLVEDITQPDFDSYISALNGAISPYDFEIRYTIPQRYKTARAERMYALVNTTSDPITQLATTHTADEMAFVQRVLDDMFEKYNTPQRETMAIKGIQAVNLARSSSNRASGQHIVIDGDEAETQASTSNSGALTKTQAQNVMDSLVDEGWFRRVGDYYTLSPRAIMELRGWLVETYNEPPDEDGTPGVERIKSCQACREIVTMGQRCKEKTCKGRLHEHCVANMFRTQRGEEKCPICRRDWTGTDCVGPKADATGRASGGGTGRASTVRRSSAPSRTNGGGASEDEEEEVLSD